MPEGKTPKKITGIYVENFKAFGPSGTTIPLGKLTLIYGPNSGGKSTILKAIASLGQTRMKKKQDPGINIDWAAEGAWFDLGNSLQVLHEGQGTKFKIGFEFEYINTGANWQKSKGEKSYWEHPEGELVSKGKVTQTWKWKLPADVPKNGCIKLFNGKESWIIHSSLHRTDEELLEFNHQTMNSKEDLTPDMVTIKGRVITVRVKSDQLFEKPRIRLRRAITIKSRLVYVFEYINYFKQTILSGIEYYEHRKGKMQLICSGERQDEPLPLWINGNHRHIHSGEGHKSNPRNSWFPRGDTNNTFFKLNFAQDTDCLVYQDCKSNNFDEAKLSMADNAIFLKMMRKYVGDEAGRLNDGGAAPQYDETDEAVNIPRGIFRPINQIENRLWDEIIDIHPNPSLERDESWKEYWPKLHDEIKQVMASWEINITPRMEQMLHRMIVDREYSRGNIGYWPSRLFRYWASAALHLNDGAEKLGESWGLLNLEKKLPQSLKAPLVQYKGDFTFTPGNWHTTVPANFSRFIIDFTELSQNIRSFVDDLDYLTGARVSPARLYSADGSHSSIGVKGQRSVANLVQKFRYNKPLLDKFNNKLSDVVNMHIHFGDVFSSFHPVENLVDIRVGRAQDEIKLLQLPDVGFGVSQVIPLIAATFYDNQTLLVEEAESNLHPAAQAKLMNVLLNSILEEGITGPSLILETHSEHFLLAVKEHLRMEGGLEDDDVSIVYVENQPGDNGSKATRINTRDGEFTTPWPRDTWGDPTNPII